MIGVGAPVFLPHGRSQATLGFAPMGIVRIVEVDLVGTPVKMATRHPGRRSNEAAHTCHNEVSLRVWTISSTRP
jgi:hypothetical protein